MSGKVIITTPFPTPEEVAAYYKIPAKRVAELDEMIDDIRRSMANAKARAKKSTARNGARKPSNGSRTSRAKK
jgi:ppGpp synthetase/RelA/SpoT-type nucleotidyltranferase